MADVEIPQITFNLRPAPAFAGMIADSSNRDVETRIAQTVLDAGYGVVKGANADLRQVKLPAQASDVTNFFAGILVYDAYRDPSGTSNRYAANDAVPVLEQGSIWVVVDGTNGATITADGPVYCVHSGAHAGKFRGDDGGGAATLVQGAKCKVSGIAGGIARIKINIP